MSDAQLTPEAIAEAAKRYGVLPGPPKAKDATPFIKWYLIATGWQPSPRSKALFNHPSGKTRLRLKATVINRESKGSTGTWHNMAGESLIDFALRVVGKKGGEQAATAAKEAKEKRGKKKKVAAVKRAEKSRREKAEELALKALEADNRAEYLAGLRKAIDPRDFLSLMESRVARTADTIERMYEGRELPERDEGLARFDEPPLLPLFMPVRYSWVQGTGRERFAVRMEHGNPRTAEVDIWALKHPMQTVNAETLRMAIPRVFWRPEEIEVERGVINGTVRYIPKLGRVFGIITYIAAAQKGGGQGTWLLQTWCRLMRGYDSDVFGIFRPGNEAQPFLRRLQARGDLHIVDDTGETWLVRCTFSPTRNIPWDAPA